MSVTVVTYVHCDGCGEPFDNAPGGRSAVTGTTCATATEQREDARRRGWRVNAPGGKDFCPDCRQR